jgi:hypothetical protein
MDGTLRFCTDYRRLNALTKEEADPLPRIQEVLRDFGNAQVFSSLDLKSGYWPIPMDPTSKYLTVFATPDGASYAIWTKERASHFPKTDGLRVKRSPR